MTRNIKFNITDASAGAAFTVKLFTRADENEFAGIEEDGSVKIRLTSSPNDDTLDDELVSFLSEMLEIDRDKIEIVAGLGKRHKLVSVEDVSPNVIEDLLNS